MANRKVLGICILTLALLVFSMFSSAFAANNWWSDSFDYRKEFTIENFGSNILVDYPVFVNISKEIGMQNDYDDLRFVYGSCSGSHSILLDYEIEENDSNRAIVWVKIPSFATGNNSICMYYGNSTINSGANPTSVWTSGYGLVYHMDSAGQDSTSNNLDRVADNGAPVSGTGFLGYDITFSANNAWSMQNMNYWEAQWNNRVHEVVFETGADINTRQTMFAEGGNVNGVMMYILNGQLYARWWSETAGWGGDYIATSINPNTRYHVVMDYSYPGSYELYLNGNLIASRSSVRKISSHSGDGGIGYTGPNIKDYHDSTTSGNYFEGKMYEFRTMDSGKDLNWYNQTYMNLLQYDSTVSVSLEEKYVPNMTIVVDYPSTASIYPILQNETFDYNITISCVGKSSSTCGNITSTLQYNDSSTTFASVPTVDSTPIWTISPGSFICELNGGESCSLSWNVNMTGLEYSLHKIRAMLVSDNPWILDNTSENVIVNIIKGNVVLFNQTNVHIGPFDKNSGSVSKSIDVVSFIGDNTNIVVECESGDCLAITDNWVDGSSLNEGLSQNIDFTCSDSTSGSFWALYNVTSDEYDSRQLINVSCHVNKIYGPLSITLENPSTSSLNYIMQNRTFKLNATVDCVGDCGTVYAYGVFNNGTSSGSWWDTTYKYRKEITITNNGGEVLTDVPILLNISYDSEMQSDYDDIRFLDGNCDSANTLLDYEVETYNFSSAYVWVKVPQLDLISDKICMYFVNSAATNGENPDQVWTNGFDLVYHFAQSGTVDRLDSTSNGYNAITKNFDGDESTTGLIGGADILDGINDYMSISGLAYSGTNAIMQTTVCSLVKSSSTNLQNIISYDRSEFWRLALKDDHTTNDVGWDTNSGSSVDDQMYSVNMADGNWHYVCGWFNATSSGNDKKIFVDGVEVLAVNAHAGSGMGSTLTRYGFIGTGSEADTFDGTTGPNNYLDGFIDDLSISSFARTPGWMRVTSDVLLNNSDIIDYGYKENFYGGDIINSSVDTPFWTISSQPQSCIPIEDGSCYFEWIVNATGPMNSEYNLSVFAWSNYSMIEGKSSNKSSMRIVLNMEPQVTLYKPIGDKIIGNGSLNISWSVLDDESILTCEVYVDGVLEDTLNCNSSMNSSSILDIGYGYHNYTIMAYDSFGNIGTGLGNFTLIRNSSLIIEKSIYNVNSDMYNIEITVNGVGNYTVIDFAQNKFNYGSFSSFYDWINVTVDGDILGWDDQSFISYSITSSDDYSLLDEYIVGLE